MSAPGRPVTASTLNAIFDEAWLPDKERVDLIRAAACEISEFAQLLADGSLETEVGEGPSPKVNRTVAQRIFTLGVSVLRCLDHRDQASAIAGDTFPTRCCEIGGLQGESAAMNRGVQ